MFLSEAAGADGCAMDVVGLEGLATLETLSLVEATDPYVRAGTCHAGHLCTVL